MTIAYWMLAAGAAAGLACLLGLAIRRGRPEDDGPDCGGWGEPGQR